MQRFSRNAFHPVSLLAVAVLGTGACNAPTPEEDPADAPAAAAQAAATTGNAVAWEYEGELGPDQWGTIDPAFAFCAEGRQQSPIDIVKPLKTELPMLGVKYVPTQPTVKHLGHTVQVDYVKGSTLALGDDVHELLQYHIHTPSEHRVEGNQFPLELHLVHRSEAGNLAVLGVLIKEGAYNPAFAPLLENLPSEEGESRQLPATHDTRLLLPNGGEGRLDTYRYTGSLTTPPCTEGVRWNVLAEPVELSPEQIERFRTVVEANARPVQPLHGRVINTG